MTAGTGVATDRCARCLLPSSLPGSSFDERGECVWCQHDFPGYFPRGDAALAEALARERRSGAPADCLVGISGGKDSSYVALQLAHAHGLRVEAFTYVHTAMSEFALGNARAVCEAMGIRQHVVSLPGDTHVRAFRAFFEAWLETGSAMAAAASCAACKHMHLLGTRLAAQRGIPLVVWADCPLENPPFRRLRDGQDSRDGLRAPGLRDVGGSVGRHLLHDGPFRRAFLHHAATCVLGGLSRQPDSAYLRLRYPHVRHLHYFDYHRWDAEEIFTALHAHTGWAIPSSAGHDWHSDCRLHLLREYMYQRMLGATEVDAHLSNRIRFGLLTREEAWSDLLRAKAHHAAALPATLEDLGLSHLEARLDLSCFEIN